MIEKNDDLSSGEQETPTETFDDGSVRIASVDIDGRGVARRDGKVIFIEGGLVGERVSLNVYRRKPSYELAQVAQVIEASSQRVEPRCKHFGVCGGCAMQHVDAVAQVAIKQRVLEDTFRHIAKLTPKQVLPAIHGPTWGYRHRARLSVRYVAKKGTVLVGFHERRSSFVADMTECHVLPPAVSDLLVPLRQLIGEMDARDRLPQIEVAVGAEHLVLVLRHMEPLSQQDLERLDSFAAQHQVVWWLQSKGLETIRPLHDADWNTLAYHLPEFGLTMPFKPADFTQVNPAINQVLVSRALMLLDPQPNERIADLFCGLGNFTLPLATRCKEVVGIEGSQTLTDRALDTAKHYGLDGHTSFSTLNLFEVDEAWLRSLGKFDRMLIDPPREGAKAVCEALSLLADERPRRIVYVSCNPATLARDAEILTQQGGFELAAAGVVNMFPHTGHVESIAVFEAR